RHPVPTALAIALPERTEAQIRPRSGLAPTPGMSIINTPRPLDSAYRGESRIPLINFDPEPEESAHGGRLAEMRSAQVLRSERERADGRPPAGRGSGGVGSTGRH